MEIEKKGNLNPNHSLTPNIKSNDRQALLELNVNTLSEISENLKTPKLRIKRFDRETLVKATNKNNFFYWLSQEDIADIARLEYNNFDPIDARVEGNIQFEIIGSHTQLSNTLKSFIDKIQTSSPSKGRLSLIINLENLHWVSIAISCNNESCLGYYVDSKRLLISPEYIQIFDEMNINLMDLSPRFAQQTDGYNCGLWALENTRDLSRMIDENKNNHWIVNTLKRNRDEEYFTNKRKYFSEKLKTTPPFREKYYSPFQSLTKLEVSLSSSHLSSSKINNKRFKVSSDFNKRKKVVSLLSDYVEAFMSYFAKELVNYRLASKEQFITMEALKDELKTALTGALVGMVFAKNPTGSVPSLTASTRSIANKYYTSKTKSFKITRIFSEEIPENLNDILAEAAVNIFYSLESQFMQITDQAGEKIAIEKLAEDAVGRMFNALNKNFDFDRPISTELLESSILYGPSEVYFNPAIKKARIRISGYTIQNKLGVELKTSDLYGKTGLIDFESDDIVKKFYIKKKFPGNKFGFRRLLNWEKDSHGALKENLKHLYQVEDIDVQLPQETQLIEAEYDYALQNYAENRAEAQQILNKINTRYAPEISIKSVNKKPIYFNLRKSVYNFSGRVNALKRLHETLMSERTIAIVPGCSKLSIDPLHNSQFPVANSDSDQASSGSQLSISGLGGIGKTQLALRYAELYASHYDRNVLWINAETLENIAYSFRTLAGIIQISIHDRYGQEKLLATLVDEAYEYFSDRKSLFIFDNVENYKMIKTYLPKTRPDNMPTILITSRYTHWDGIANVVLLDVFTEKETTELINKSLDLADHTSDNKIHELNQLLQGLPLALQQALAYIKLKRKTKPNFSFDGYIKLYKEKSENLLNFDFSEYSNDPYLKTIFTTWQITLENIVKESLGQEAIDILTIMAFLYPDAISSSKIDTFSLIIKTQDKDALNKIMHLLTSYSMINFDGQAHYSIHRLVQETLRLQLQKDPSKFEIIFNKTHFIMLHWEKHYKKDEERIFHYLHFLLNVINHDKIITQTIYRFPEKKLLDTLILNEGKYCNYFIDLASMKYTTENFLKFLSTATAYYIKAGSFFILNEIFFHLKNKYDIGFFSDENIKFFFTYYDSLNHKVFKLKAFSKLADKRKNQIHALQSLTEFKEKILDDLSIQRCPGHYLKRSICLRSNDEEKKKLNKNFKIKLHFEKIGQISRYLSSGIITKDIVSALLQGHFDDVAFNFELITSSVFFGKISNHLFTQGEKLFSKASLLEKDLNLENKKVLEILWNKQLLFTSKRKFLGKMMQVASPFVAKATSIFFAYNLKNEIQAYKAGHKEVLPSIVSNSIILGVDGLEVVIEGAQFLELIAEVSAFTGPIGEWITLLTWIVTDAYVANQQLEAIEKYVRLSRGEKFFESLLSMLHQEPLEYMQLKVQNGQRVAQAINFLKKNTAIQWYIFPSSKFPEDLCNIRKIRLDKKINFTLDDSNPDQPTEGNLFCLAASPPPNDPKNKSTNYVCHQALGVSYSLNRTDNVMLVNLGEGEDEVVAFSSSSNVFRLENGKKKYRGGDAGNIFDLQGNSITGNLHGGKGTDILLLENFQPVNSNCLLLDDSGSLCGKNDLMIESFPLFCPDKNRIQINQIDQIYGRKNEADLIYLDHFISFIDGYGGKNRDYPDSFFIPEHTSKNLTFVLRNNTVITFSSKISSADSVDYRIPLNETGNTWIHYYSERSIQHRLLFECSLQNIDVLTIKNNTLHISSKIQNEKIFSITFVDYSSYFNNQTQDMEPFYKNFYYQFNDIEVKLINNDYLYGREIVSINKTQDEIINLLKTTADHLQKTFSIQLMNNLTISIGQKNKHEIFYINSAFENHLVGNGGENVYAILANNNTVFPLSKIILYDTDEIDSNELIERINSIDLSEVIKQYKQTYPGAAITSYVFSAENDLIITLNNAIYIANLNSYDKNCFLPWATILLKNALLNDINWYQKLIVFLDRHPKNIVPLEKNFWILDSEPVIFTNDKKIIFLTNFDLEEESIVYILKKIGNFSFFRNATDLILTNFFISAVDYCIIIYYQFFQDREMKKKVLSAIFKFFNQEISLKNYQKEIEHALSFQSLSELLLINKNKTDIFYNSYNELSSSQMEQEDQLKPILRYKRQIHLEEKILADTRQKPKIYQKTFTNISKMNHYSQSQLVKDDRILTIAEDYLRKYDSSLTKNKKVLRKNKKSISPQTIYEKAPPMIEKSHFIRQKNNEKHLLQSKQKKWVNNKLNWTEKSPSKNKFLITSPFQSKSTITKDNFFNNSNFKKAKKSVFMPNNALDHQDNGKLNGKTSSIVAKLTYEKNGSNSKKSNLYPASSYVESPNLHNTLMFINFITKAAKGRPASISYDKKANKTIKKVQKQNEKIKASIFGIQHLH